MLFRFPSASPETIRTARQDNVAPRRSARGRARRRIGALMAGVALAATTALGSAFTAPEATAAPAGSADAFLKATGQPGPHRIPGHYFTSPGIPQAQRDAAPSVLAGPSMPIYVGNNICTLSVVGYDKAGNKVGITAGHCGGPGAPVVSMDAEKAGQIGTVVRNGYPDVAVIKFNNKVRLTRSYNNVSIGALGGATPASLQQLCKTGVATGVSCGPMLAISGPFLVSHLCGSIGDSGAPIYVGNRLVGIVNGGMANLPSCTTPLQGPLHAPTAGAAWNVIAADLNAAGGVGAGFRLP